MELYEIKNGLTKAHLLMTEFYQSIDIEAYRREIEQGQLPFCIFH